MLVIGVMGFSLSTLVAGAAPTLLVFAMARFFFGCFASAINVPIYEIVAANFPEERRSTANSFVDSGVYFGAGFASLMLLIIKNYGWRVMYFTMGSFGLLLAFLIMTLVKNPPKIK